MITGKNYIGSKLVGSHKPFKTFNPKSNSENPYEFYEASSEDINKAVAIAKEAFYTYKNISGAKKSEFLNAIADEILALGDELINTYTQESGLPEGRAIGERGRTMGQLRLFANLVAEGSWLEASIDTAQPKREPLPKADIRKMLIPMGPVVVFGASNFPLAFSTAGGDTASALASGCPVIVKSHPMHAGTGELVSSAIIKAAKKTGMPNGVFSNLNSSGIEVGVELTKHPDIKCVVFTGSFRGGKALFDIANSRPEPIPVFAEMGSINPVVLLPEALKSSSDSLAKNLAGSITLGAGQFCTNPGLVLSIKSKELTSFSKTLSELLQDMDASCMLHPNIKRTYEQNQNEITSQEHISVLTNSPGTTEINFVEPQLATVEGSVFLKNPTLHKEVFGPFSLIVQCIDEEELLKVVKCLEGQLTATLMADDNELSKYPELVNHLLEKVGRLIYNGMPTGVEVCPSMQHGGPYPSTTDSRFTSVGTGAIKRFVRPLSYQNWPHDLLPDELKNENPLEIYRIVNGEYSQGTI
ncbi:NADP-dependent aldehyde dehydrogenase [Saonia flava]|uniref:NADP-dependent aldehyde dehydrogenase n=1 Tax=Saonia flava TaxID=523696 RepID=A0A846QWD2_9FLAO|nr:aldehyde dehydrogenase (NADP(+)) [Saonia flava]NJB70583.1 NADP-dependent aldehyde dehydrogenase [Saonia flava]